MGFVGVVQSSLLGMTSYSDNRWKKTSEMSFLKQGGLETSLKVSFGEVKGGRVTAMMKTYRTDFINTLCPGNRERYLSRLSLCSPGTNLLSTVFLFVCLFLFLFFFSFPPVIHDSIYNGH